MKDLTIGVGKVTLFNRAVSKLISEDCPININENCDTSRSIRW